MTPAIVKTTGDDPMIFVPEQWGVKTEDARDGGAVRMELPEILSRFSQSLPVEDQRLGGHVDGNSEILIEGNVGGIEVHLIVRDPNTMERYRIHAQKGWIYGAFSAGRFSFVNVKIDSEWVSLEIKS